MIDKLHWLGHDSFRLDGTKVVYFDPWKIPKGARKADIILVSHEHFDHFSKPDIAAISTKDTVIVTTQAVAGELKAAKIPCGEVKALLPGESFETEGVRIRGVASYNVNKDFHPKKANKLGFLVEMSGQAIYHAGDTDYIPEMDEYRCDIALLPVSGTYVMTAAEAAQAAIAIAPKIAVPMHYGDVAGTAADAKAVAELLNGKIEVRIMKKEK